MGRRKARPAQPNRNIVSERSFYHELAITDQLSIDNTDILNLIRGGEDSYIELKVRLTNNDKIANEIAALANSGGGAIIFGVNDNRRIEGLDDAEKVEEELREICREISPPVHPLIDKIAFDNGRRIVLFEVENRRAPHFVKDYRYYIREGATIREAHNHEIAELFAKFRPSGYESIPLFGCTLNDIEESFVWSYVRELQGELFKNKGNYPTGDVLREMQIAIEYADNYVPTVAGLLLFGDQKSIEQRFSRSSLVMQRFSGESINDPLIEKVVCWGNLATLFEKGLKFIHRYVDSWENSVPRANRNKEHAAVAVARANYHRPSIIETLTNALVHRDYSFREQPTKINIYDHHLEIINPFHRNDISKRGIELYGVVLATNPRLKAIFKSPAYGLKTVQGGIPMMRKIGFRATQMEPKILIHAEEFKVELFGV